MNTSLRLAMIASLLAMILSATPLAQETVSPGWEVGNVGFATKPAFDFGPDGRLHVMGMTEDFSGVVWHASATSVAGPWPTTILAAGYFYGPGDIRVDPGGDAHLAWHNHTEQDPNHGVVDNQGGVTVYRIDTPTRTMTGGTTRWPWTPRGGCTWHRSIPAASGPPSALNTAPSTVTRGPTTSFRRASRSCRASTRHWGLTRPAIPISPIARRVTGPNPPT